MGERPPKKEGGEKREKSLRKPAGERSHPWHAHITKHAWELYIMQ